VPYKRVDLVVEAFTKLGLPLVVIGDGSEFRRVAALAGPTVRLLGPQPDDVVRDHMQRCKAFVYPAEEDFGIAMVEAQAAGAPVIGYGRGGAAETVIPGKTGILMREQTVAAVMAAVRSLEAGDYPFSPDDSRQNAERFSPERFRAELAQFVDQQWAKFQRG